MLTPINAMKAVESAPEGIALLGRSCRELDSMPLAKRRAIHDAWERMAEKVTLKKTTIRKGRHYFAVRMP